MSHFKMRDCQIHHFHLNVCASDDLWHRTVQPRTMPAPKQVKIRPESFRDKGSRRDHRNREQLYRQYKLPVILKWLRDVSKG